MIKLWQSTSHSETMQINIASKNPAKVHAVEEIILEYPHLAHATICALEVASGVADQPRSLDETISGAINRARNAFLDCDYAIGIESGLMEVPYTKTGYMDVCACAIFDGTEIHLGLSSAWEAPRAVAEYMLHDGLDMNDAAFRAGLTTDPKVGSREGLVGIMTKGRLTRKAYTKEALRTALIHLEREAGS